MAPRVFPLIRLQAVLVASDPVRTGVVAVNAGGPFAGTKPVISVGDRVPGAVLWNLFDIDAKFGDVETVESCLQQLDRIAKDVREPVTA